jgi:hypothetical protein
MNQAIGSVDPKRCPLCGGANDCGRVAGKDKCWCFTACISLGVIERVPELARGLACICERCASKDRSI